MKRSWLALVVLAALVMLVVVATPRRAHADQPGAHTVPVAVLALDSEDSEEQADALTGALRSRVRAAQGWSLIETTQSLGMLTAALKCPSHPPADCQQKISEQIKAERYIWGFVTRGPTTGQVTAEIHLYQKNKSDTVLKESYADNLKDANDDTLRKVAARIVERLGGTALGVVVVKAGELNGEVVVDGEKRVPLQKGTARIELAPGGHSIEVASTGIPSSKRNVLVVIGKEAVVEIAPTQETEPPHAEKPFPTRTVVGGVVLGAGVILGAVAVQQALFYGELQDRGKEVAKRVEAGQKPCEPSGDQEFCNIDNRSKTASAFAIAGGAVGAVAIGTGLYLLLTNGSSEKTASAPKRPQIVPTFGANSGGVMINGAF
ncbi:hypothetical protein AKJ09_02685 [Labilithrix luteola]|uniref:PEGA domain-containing protein n=1 Tax=Labilithrix luteola TaxID=1391654 RepID=A0A0K1PRL6_9BACT|nr:hypothetical protein [Labilithrix luteola]AKU96021.1 hypothetical protein AKJ09_02685 [Labilithrix luteola]